MEGESFETSDGTTRWVLRFGTQKISLHQADREFEPKARQPAPGAADIRFPCNARIEDRILHLSARGIVVELGPVQRSGATGPITSICILDPDGKLLEIDAPA